MAEKTSVAGYMANGAALFADVQHYAASAHHRTGTPEDHATLDWFAA